MNNPQKLKNVVFEKDEVVAVYITYGTPESAGFSVTIVLRGGGEIKAKGKDAQAVWKMFHSAPEDKFTAT